jgi:hypothetical protein
LNQLASIGGLIPEIYRHWVWFRQIGVIGAENHAEAALPAQSTYFDLSVRAICLIENVDQVCAL